MYLFFSNRPLPHDKNSIHRICMYLFISNLLGFQDLNIQSHQKELSEYVRVSAFVPIVHAILACFWHQKFAQTQKLYTKRNFLGTNMMGHSFVVHVQSINQLYLGHKFVGCTSVYYASFVYSALFGIISLNLVKRFFFQGRLQVLLKLKVF